MSFGARNTPIDECHAPVNCPRLRQRRNGLANIFASVDTATLQKNGWGDYSPSSQVGGTVDGDSSDITEDNDTPVVLPDSPRDIADSPGEIDTPELTCPVNVSVTLPSPSHDYGLEQLWRGLSQMNIGKTGYNNRLRRTCSRTISLDEVCVALQSLDNKRRRNGSPYILDTISDSQLQGLVDIFISAVCDDGSRQVFPVSNHVQVR